METIIATVIETVCGAELRRIFSVEVHAPGGSVTSYGLYVLVNHFIDGRQQTKSALYSCHSGLSQIDAKQAAYARAREIRDHYRLDPTLHVAINQAHVSDLAKFFNS